MLLFLLVVVGVQADLPVHCVGDDVVGDWTLFLGPSGYTSTISCGHAMPDDPFENWGTKMRTYKTVKEYKVTLFANNSAADHEGHQGTWTMIYDEGWELIIDSRRYFAFSKFVPRPGLNLFAIYPDRSKAEPSVENYQSICDETIDGWFHKDDNTDWGCYYAIKTHAPKQIDDSDSNPMEILGPTGQFLEISSATLEFSKYANARVQQINRQQLPWTARINPSIEGMSLLEIKHMMGNNKPINISAVPDTRADHIRYADLPPSFDWRNVGGVNYVPQARKQGSCGSCYVIAATQMIESRIRIQTKNQLTVRLSPQSVLSCSRYSQGCKGGFPYLVGKFGQDFGFLEESCLPYVPKHITCDERCSNPRVWHTTNYRYVGGAYGRCSEVAMMREILENGPIVVGFNAPQDLFFYSGGVYHGKNTGERLAMLQSSEAVDDEEEDDGEIASDNKPAWHAFFEKTNHAVLAVGWGVENDGTKFWIVQNTWGDDWGDEGYFRIVRGRDVCSFEAMAVAFEPVIPEEYLHLQAAPGVGTAGASGVPVGARPKQPSIGSRISATPMTIQSMLSNPFNFPTQPQFSFGMSPLVQRIQRNGAPSIVAINHNTPPPPTTTAAAATPANNSDNKGQGANGKNDAYNGGAPTDAAVQVAEGVIDLALRRSRHGNN